MLVPGNEEKSNGHIQSFPLWVHEKATLSSTNYEDRIELTLTNNETGAKCERTYYKIDDMIPIQEALKIDAILYHMSNEIGLNLWGNQLN